MARIYDRKKIYDSAIKYNTLALKLTPNNFTANNNLGSVLLTAGRYREAIPYFYIAVQNNPNFKYAYLNAARCYQQLKQFDSAIYNFRKVLEFEPQNYDLYTEIGTSHFMLAKYDSAEYYFKLVLQQKPDDANVINNIGAILLNNQRYAEAVVGFNFLAHFGGNMPRRQVLKTGQIRWNKRCIECFLLRNKPENEADSKQQTTDEQHVVAVY
jgi:Tfp pilus assembly protein PilF